MGMGLLATSCLYGNSSSQQLWHNRSSFTSFSNASLTQAWRLINKKNPFLYAETLYLPISKNNGLFSISAAAERDMELAEVELQDTTPLETFVNRHSSFLEGFEAGKIRRIIAAGSINLENPSPSILVMLGNELFVNQLCNEYPEGSIEVNHFSFNVLADIKERHDETRCFHMSTADFSEISGSFNAVFLNYFPIFSKSLPKLLKDVTRFCKPGGTVVLSLAQDKSNLVSLKAQSGGLLQSNFPDEDSLVKMISALPLELVSFEDLPNFYLAALKYTGAHNQGKKASMKNITLSKDDSEYPLYIKGEVIHGFGRGSKKLGFPTANLSVESLPVKVAKLQKGVYFGCAQIVGEGVDANVHRMVMNLGNRPTFDKDDTLSLEVHILHDFGTDFYGKELRVAILGFIREEMQFPSVDELIRRIKKDVELMQECLSDADLHFQKGVDFFAPR